MLNNLFKSLLPWLIFFAFFGYEQLEFQLGAIGALVALLLLARRGLRRWFVFDWSSLLFFVFICAAIYLFEHRWVYANADVVASLVLTAIAWSSLIVNRPFTMQYAKQSVAKEYWQTKRFHRINTHLTLLWACCFSLMALLGGLSLWDIGNRQWMGEILPMLLVALALWVSLWYPEKMRQDKKGQWGVITLPGLSDLHSLECMSTTMSYRSIGHGSVVVLLPRNNMSMYGWDPDFIVQLAKQHQVILLDYPDIGASHSKIGEMHSIQSLARVINEFVEELDLRSYILVGFGFGGWVAQRMAIDYGKQVRGLVLIASDVGGARASVPPKEKLALLDDNSISLEEQTKHLLNFWFPAAVREQYHERMESLHKTADMLRELPEETINNQQAIIEHWYANEGTYNELSQINQPSLIITGILDGLVHRQNALVLSNGLSHSRLIEYADSGYGVLYQHPSEIADTVIRYFKGS